MYLTQRDPGCGWLTGCVLAFLRLVPEGVHLRNLLSGSHPEPQTDLVKIAFDPCTRSEHSRATLEPTRQKPVGISPSTAAYVAI